MTAIRFNDVSSNGRSPRQPGKSRQVASRVAMLSIGAAFVVSGSLVAMTHFATASLPSAQTAALPAQDIDIASLTPAAVAPLETARAPQKSERGARLKPSHSASADSERAGRVVSSRGDRLAQPEEARSARVVQHRELIDQRRFAAISTPFDAVRMADSARFMLAPADTSAGENRVGLSSRLMAAAHTQDYARFALAVAATQDREGEAVMPPSETVAAGVPHPELRPAQQAALLAAKAESLPDAVDLPQSIPLPTARPQMPAHRVERLASLEPQAGIETSDALPGVALPQSAPLPRSRPARVEQAAPARAEQAAPARPARIEQASAPSRPTASHSQALAYASPDDASTQNNGGLLSGLGKLFSGGSHAQMPGAGSGVAVYDIKTATVYMPNGEKLEAHSGLGHMQDNPRYVTAKNKGPTPPNVYNLVMRESRFHGVEAVRLLPADGKKKYNRDGLLAHTYMYRGGTSQSNGCVVFKNYPKFLKAFKRGRIKRLVVVPSIDKLPTYTASL